MQSIETGAGTQCSGVKFSGGGESQRSIKRGGRSGRHPHVGGKFTLGDDVGLFHSAGSRSVECTAARLFNHPSLGFFRSLPPFVRSAARVRAFRWCFGETVRVGRDTRIVLQLSSTASRLGSCACVPSSAEVCLRFGPHHCQHSVGNTRLLSGTLLDTTAWHTAAFCTEICRPYSGI